MQPDKDYILEELDHQRTMAKLFRKRLRILEMQFAQQGMNTPPQILTEIATINEQIKKHESEVSRLKTAAAEDEMSLSEAEYRVMLSESWDTPLGRPKQSSLARLELARLRMGLLPERSAYIEAEVRVALSEEAFTDLDVKFYEYLPMAREEHKIVQSDVNTLNIEEMSQEKWNEIASISSNISAHNVAIYNPVFGSRNNPYDDCFKILGRSIRLDPQTALWLFSTALPADFKLDLEFFAKKLLSINRVWSHQSDRYQFEQFLTMLKTQLDQP